AFSTTTRDVAADSLFRAIKSGRWKGPIEQIRFIFTSTLERTGDREAAKRAISPLKCKLPGILPSGTFSQRGNDKLVAHSGLLDADLDSLGDELPGVREKLLKSPYLWALFLSPSGDGLKAIFRVLADES